MYVRCSCSGLREEIEEKYKKALHHADKRPAICMFAIP